MNECKANGKKGRYEWHDLRKNPDDLPLNGERIYFYSNSEFDGKQYWTGEYYGLLKWFENDDYEAYFTEHIYKLDSVIAWKYIEHFEGGE